jgi:hypothetical protein
VGRAHGFISRVFLSSFAFVFYEGKRVLAGCLGTLMAVPDNGVSGLEISFKKLDMQSLS